MLIHLSFCVIPIAFSIFSAWCARTKERFSDTHAGHGVGGGVH